MPLIILNRVASLASCRSMINILNRKFKIKGNLIIGRHDAKEATLFKIIKGSNGFRVVSLTSCRPMIKISNWQFFSKYWSAWRQRDNPSSLKYLPCGCTFSAILPPRGHNEEYISNSSFTIKTPQLYSNFFSTIVRLDFKVMSTPWYKLELVPSESGRLCANQFLRDFPWLSSYDS